MKLLALIAARNLKRNLLRTTLTIAGAAVALVAFITLRTVLYAWNVGADHAPQDRLMSRHKITFVLQLPKHYAESVRGVGGVKEATFANWFGARVPSKPDEVFTNLAVDAPTYLRVYDEIELSEADKARWLGNKSGALVGAALAEKMGWSVGQKIVLEGTYYPGDWELEIAGIYKSSRPSFDQAQLFLHWGYVNDSLDPAQRDRIGWVNASLADPTRSAQISTAIDQMFDAKDTPTLTMTEHGANASFLAGFSTVFTVLEGVSFAMLGIMMLLLGNTIAMGVRERTREYATLRAIGFGQSYVRLFIIGEAVALGSVAGAIALAIAFPFVNSLIGPAVQQNMGGFFPYFRIAPATPAVAIALALGLGAAASWLPSLRATRISVTDGLRHVG